jgi:hypothetical protein
MRLNTKDGLNGPPAWATSQVNHSVKEYVRYEDGVCITTNTIEGYFATLKRGINGVYHHVGNSICTAT